MTYTPQLYPVKDSIGNRYYAGVQYDEIDGTRCVYGYYALKEMTP